MHAEIRAALRKTHGDQVSTATRIIYGGSVKADNCDALFAKADVDGFLVSCCLCVFAVITKVYFVAGCTGWRRFVERRRVHPHRQLQAQVLALTVIMTVTL